MSSDPEGGRHNYRLSNHCFINELILVTYALISNAVENRERAKAGTNVWYQIFGTKVYKHQNGTIMQIKVLKLDHEFIIGSSIKCM